MPANFKAIHTGLLASAVPVLVTRQHVIVAASRGLEQLLSASEGELINTSIFDWMPAYQGDGKKSQTRYDEAMQRGTGTQGDFIEYKVRDSAGNLIEVEMAYDIFQDGEEEYSLVYLLKSETKHHTLLHLKENEKLFRTLADNAPVLLKMANARNLYFYFSQRWMEFVGIANEEATQNHWLEYVHPEDLPQVLTQLDQAYKKRKGFDFAYRLRRADGVYRNVQDVGVPYTDDKGFFLGYISSTIDKDEELVRQKVESADKFHHAIEETLDKAGFLAFSIDGQDRIAYRNAYFTNALAGFSEDDSLGRKWSELFLISFDGATFTEDELPKPFPQNFYLKTRQPADSERIFRCNTFYYLPEGDLRNYDFGSTIIGEDITEDIRNAAQLKDANERLIDRSARLKALFDSSSQAIFTLNRQFEITGQNQFFENLTPHRRDEALGDARSLFDSRENRNRFEAGCLSAFDGNSISLEMDISIPNSGERAFWHIQVNPIRHEDDQTIKEVSVTAQEITARRKAENEVKRSENKFRNIFQSLQDVYFQIDLRGKIILVSPSVKEVTGYEIEELTGRDLNDFLIYTIRLKRSLKLLIQQKRAKNIDIQIVKKDGDVIDCICSLSLFKDIENGIFGFEGTLRDITEIKQTNLQLQEAKETAERSLKVKEKFLANMSHEIRTPMNGIIGLVDLLLEDDLSPKNREFMETIKRSSATLLAILNDILDLSKIEAGKMQVKRNDFVLADSLDKVLNLFTQIAANKNIGLSYVIDPEVPYSIKTDETRLVQILSNLTSNAIKFTDKGFVNIHVVQESQTGDSLVLRFDVIDTGIGISEGQVGQLFNQFNQLDNSLTKSYGGTGLGLVISRNLAQLLGGEMGVESTTGQGSRFFFTIACRVGKAVSEKQLEPVIDVSKPLSGKVLVVDDNGVNRRVALEILNTVGIRPWQASNGQEALDLCNEQKFDLILMDIQMPVMDGITSMKEIKKGLNENTTIVALTAYSMKEDKAKFLKQGFSDYLSKPITKNSLLNIAAKYLNIAQQNESKESLESRHAPEVDAEIINMEVFMDLQSLIGFEGLMETYAEFIKESSDLLKDIDDPQQRLSVAHTIKGSAGTLGISKVYEAAKKLEAAVREENLPAIEPLKEELFFTFDSFIRYFEAKLNPVNS